MKCKNCKNRKATTLWIDDDQAFSLAMSHGCAQEWCELCILKVQLEHAENLAITIPDLKRKIKELENNGQDN